MWSKDKDQGLCRSSKDVKYGWKRTEFQNKRATGAFVMSTTYAKIRATLGQMTSQKSWPPEDLKTSLAERDDKRGENIFRIRVKGSQKMQRISDDALDRLFNTMLDLKLIEQNNNEDLCVLEAIQQVLGDQSRYQIVLSRRVTAFLDGKDAKMSNIRDCAATINYPDVRDADTIFLKLKDKGHAKDLRANQFSQLIFLLACAQRRATRHMRVFYEFN